MGLDITMCPGGACPLRQRCYRYRAVTEGRQDYFATPPFDDATGTCAYLWDIAGFTPTDDAIRTRAYHLWQLAGCPDGAADGHWRAAQAQLIAAATAMLRDDLP